MPAETAISRSWPRPKTWTFAAIAAMMLYVVYHNERFLVVSTDPNWLHIAPFKWWLLVHGLAGACALPLAPLQFSDRLRKRYAKVHRIIGRFYVTGALILAPLGAYIQYVQERMGAPRSFTVLSAVDAVLLISTTSIAFLFAVRRRITLHRQWMTRSYAVALVFFEGRLIMGVTGLGASVEASEAIIWSCLALALLFAEIANNWHEIQSAAVPAPARQANAEYQVPNAKKGRVLEAEY